MMASPPLFMELMTGNLPLRVFAQPVILLILLFGYGIPVLVLREVSVRWRLGPAGLFVLGAAYGLFNEGFGAKTVFSRSIPVPSFDGYGQLLGVNLAWAAYFMPVHALASVVVPVLLVHHAYPAVKDAPWLGAGLTAFLGAFSGLFGAAIFFSPYPFQVERPLQYFIALAACIVGLAFAARLMPKTMGQPAAGFGFKPVFLGACAVFYLIGLDLLANMKVDVGLFILAWAGLLVIYALALRREGWVSGPALAQAGIGVLMVLAVTGTINTVVLKGYPEGLASGPLFAAGLMWAAFRIGRSG